jgi:hypothetical protein
VEPRSFVVQQDSAAHCRLLRKLGLARLDRDLFDGAVIEGSSKAAGPQKVTKSCGPLAWLAMRPTLRQKLVPHKI